MARRQRSTSHWQRAFAPVVLGFVLLAGWQALTVSGTIPASLLPAPGVIWERLVADLAEGRLWPRIWITVKAALLGCLLATSIALPLGYLVARNKVAESALSPYLAASQAIPAVALAPLLVLWVGYGMLPVVLLCALLVFFPVVLATVLGLRSIERDVAEAAQLDGATGPKMLFNIEAPLARPAVVTGLRNGFTLSITGAIVGEMVMGGEGLGMVLSVQAAANDTAGLFSTILVLCALAIAIYLAMLWVEAMSDPLRDASPPASQSSPPNDEDPEEGVNRDSTTSHHRRCRRQSQPARERLQRRQHPQPDAQHTSQQDDHRAHLHPEHPVRADVRGG